ncbi:hypothetical protein [Qipengyuania atrilutea]|uniref:Uncharacterized protein n=1 Tax=Qipengyuania atrilutea TaxID=2744473 RepID=A0A850GZW3_9SPHN|nr:hypothetical protein [Actirhodobacter atriluteus]NVD45171.1 hypothetical protein [Actirhodobacter atriluteus]
MKKDQSLIAHSGFSAAVALWFGLLFGGIAAVLPAQMLASTFGLSRLTAALIAAAIGIVTGFIAARIVRAIRRRSLARYDFVPASEPPRWTLRDEERARLQDAEDEDDEEPLFAHFTTDNFVEEPDETAEERAEPFDLPEAWEEPDHEAGVASEDYPSEQAMTVDPVVTNDDAAGEATERPTIDPILSDVPTTEAEGDTPKTEEQTTALLEDESLALLVQRLEEAVARLSERDERIQNAARSDSEPVPRPQNTGSFAARRESIGPFRMRTRTRSRRDKSK